MIALVLASILGTAAPAPACRGGDISVTALRIKLIKGSASAATADRLLITGDFTNVGSAAQEDGVRQHAELLRNGAIIARQKLPALAAGVTYPLQFRIFRETSQRTDPVEVLVRYVLDDRRHAARDDCLATNDSLTKVF
jgi:hypothetical protein